MNKEKIRKILFYISLIMFLIKTLVSVFIVVFAQYYNLLFFKFFEIIDHILSPFVLLLAFIYITYYIFVYFEKASKKTKKNKNSVKYIKLIIFIICILIWLFLIGKVIASYYVGYYCSICGFSGGGDYGEMYYGFDAVIYSFYYVFSLIVAIPIFPVSFIYIIYYLCDLFINKNK